MAWDPLVLEVYVDCEIYKDKSIGEAKSKMAGFGCVVCNHRLWTREDNFAECSPQEAATPIELRVMSEAWDGMARLDQRVQLHYIQPEYSIFPCVPSPATWGQNTHAILR